MFTVFGLMNKAPAALNDTVTDCVLVGASRHQCLNLDRICQSKKSGRDAKNRPICPGSGPEHPPAFSNPPPSREKQWG